MYLDKLLQLDPAGTAITVTAASTNVLDGQQVRDLGIGDHAERLTFFVTVGAAFTAVGAATLTIQVQGSVDNAVWTTYVQTDAIPKANLTAGKVIKVPLPPQDAAPHAAGRPRYYRLNYVVATGPFTAGTVESDLVPEAQQNDLYYAPGFTVAN